MSAPTCPDCGAPLSSVDGPDFCPGCLLGCLSGDLPEPFGGEPPEELLGGRYRLEAQIGEGGFAAVWRAWQVSPVQRVVAVKWLKPEVVSPQVLARFDGERSALARMNHPGVATVLDAGSHDGRPFFVVELVLGHALTTAATACRLDAEARCRVFIQICEAVQHAHGKGVVHRDLKPSNLMAWEESGILRVKVIDFGVARALADPLSDLAATAVRQLVGTPGYMSPEQADPGSADIDVRSDVYALGVVLYELLAGCLPFPALARRSAAGSAPAWPPAAVIGRAPRPWQRDLLAIADRALATAPSARYAGAQALADDVQRVLDEQPVSARPQRGLYALGKLARRHRATVVLSLLSLTSLIAGLAVSLGLFFRAEQQARELRLAQARQDRQTAQRWKSERHFPGAMPVLARALATGSDPAAEADLLTQAAYGRFMEPLGPALPLDPEWGELITTAQTGPVLLALMSGTAAAPPVLVRWLEEDRTMGNPTVYPLPEKSPVTSLSMSDSGSRAAVWGAEQRAWLLDLTAATWLPVVWPEGGAATFASLHRTGHQGIIATAGGCLWRAGRLRAELLCRLDGKITAFLAVPQRGGLTLIAATSSGKVYRWVHEGDSAPPEPLFTLPAAVTALISVENGRTVIAGDAKGNIQWHDPAKSTPPLIPASGRSGAVTVLAAGPRGRTVFAAFAHGVVRGWETDTMEPTGPQGDIAERIVDMRASGGSAEVLVTGVGGSLRMWHTATGHITPLIAAPGAQSAGHGSPHARNDPGRLVQLTPDRKFLTVMSTVPRHAGPILLQPQGATHLTWLSDHLLTGIDEQGSVAAWQIPSLGRRSFSSGSGPRPLDAMPDGAEAVIVLEADGRVVRHREGATPEVLAAPLLPATRWSKGCLSPASRRMLLTGGDARTVVLASWADGQAREISRLEESTPITALALSPDGTRIASGHADGEVAFRLADGTGRLRSLRHPASVNVLVWGPAERAASASADGSLILWDTSTAQPWADPLHQGSPTLHLTWAADGGRLAAATASEITVIDASSGFTLGPPLPLVIPLETLALNPSGTRLAGSFSSSDPRGLSEAMIWPLPPPASKVPPWFRRFAAELSGQRLTSAGQLEPVPPPARQELARLIPANDASPAGQLARWLTLPDLPPEQLHPWLTVEPQTLQAILLDWPPTAAVKRLRNLLRNRGRGASAVE